MAILTTDTVLERSAFSTEQLAPFEIWEVPYNGATIKFFQPLVLEPTWMPDDPDEPSENEYLQVIRSDINIDVWAETRDELLEVVLSEICFVWEHIVLQEDSELDAESKRIKRKHLAIAELVDG